MRLLEEIDRHEVMRRWALGELNSVFFRSVPKNLAPGWKEETLRLLLSRNVLEQEEGVRQGLAHRAVYAFSIPENTLWYRAELSLTEPEFARLRVIEDPEWVRRAGSSKSLVSAATYLDSNPGADGRVEGVLAAVREDSAELTGITLIGQSDVGPLTVAEGTARLIAVYLTKVRPGLSLESNLEVAIGLSRECWCFA